MQTGQFLCEKNQPGTARQPWGCFSIPKLPIKASLMRHCLSWDSMVCPEKATPPLHYHLLPKAVSGNLFWVPLQYPGVVAQSSSHFSDDYLPVLLRFQLLVSCIMHFISSLSSVHKFSIYFHPGLDTLLPVKQEKFYFFHLFSGASFLSNTAPAFFCHLFLPPFFVILLLQIFEDTTFPAASLQSHCLQLLSVPCCQ